MTMLYFAHMYSYIHRNSSSPCIFLPNILSRSGFPLFRFVSPTALNPEGGVVWGRGLAKPVLEVQRTRVLLVEFLRTRWFVKVHEQETQWAATARWEFGVCVGHKRGMNRCISILNLINLFDYDYWTQTQPQRIKPVNFLLLLPF